MEITRLTKDILKTLERLDDENSYNMLHDYYEKNLSNYYFPNCLIAFYPRITEQKTRKDIVCDFSEAIIPKGETYINYRPLLECLNTGQTFVLKRSIKCDPYYWNILPTNISELEDLNNKIICPKIEDDELHLDGLRYYGEIKLLKLNKTRRNNNENRYCK